MTNKFPIERLRKIENECSSMFWNSIDIFDDIKDKIETLRLKEISIEEFITSEEKDDKKISYYLVLSEGQLKIKRVIVQESYEQPTRLMKILAVKERTLERLLKAITIELERKISERMTDLENLKKAFREVEKPSEQK